MRVIRKWNTVMLGLLGVGTIANAGRGEETGAAVSTGAAVTGGAYLLEHTVGFRAIRMDGGDVAKRDTSTGQAAGSGGACDVHKYPEVDLCFLFLAGHGGCVCHHHGSCRWLT